MLQHVNTVLIGTDAPASYTTVDALTNGQIALFDEERVLVKDAAAAEKAKALYIGVCEGKEDVYDVEGTKHTKSIVRYSMPIQKGSKPHMVFTEFEASREDKIVITFTNVNPEVGHRYVLRLVYGDIYEDPSQKTQSYEHIAKTTNAADLAAAFAKKINKNKASRVVATVADAVLTLEAKVIPYNEGITLDYGYTQVAVEAFMWTTIPSGLLSSAQYPISNLMIAKTQGTPGHGNPYIVRDREDAAMGYRGITHRANGIYPYIAPEFKSDLTAQYDTVTLEWDNLYLSDDNQYIKTTPLACELYVNSGELESSAFLTAMNAFVAKA